MVNQFVTGRDQARAGGKKPSLQEELAQYSGMDDQGNYIGNDPAAIQAAGLATTQARRTQLRAEDAKNVNTMQIPTVLPDPKWDAYFGAVNNRANLAEEAGGSMRVDFGGRRGDSWGNDTSAAADPGGGAASVPGMRATRPGVGALSLSADYGYGGEGAAAMRQSDADAGQAFNLSRARIAAEREDDAYNRGEVARTTAALDTPAFELGSGRAGKFEQIRRDSDRDQAVQDARTKAGAYFDPLITRQRDAEQADKERELEIRYNRQDETNAKIMAAQIAAQSRVDVANTNAQGGLVRAGVNGMVRANETSQFVRPDPNKQSTVDGMLLRYAQGGQPPGPGGISNEAIDALMEGAFLNDAGRDQWEQVWGTLTPEEQQAAMARAQQRHAVRR